MSCYVMLCYVMLCYVMLCYVTLHCIIIIIIRVQVYYITFYNKLYSIVLGSILHYRSTPTRISERRTPCGKGKQLTWAWKLSS